MAVDKGNYKLKKDFRDTILSMVGQQQPRKLRECLELAENELINYSFSNNPEDSRERRVYIEKVEQLMNEIEYWKLCIKIVEVGKGYDIDNYPKVA